MAGPARACKEQGIKLIGDVPIFVAHDSADVWAHPDLFYLDEHGRPAVRGRRAARLLQRGRASSGAIRSIAGRPTPKDGYAWWLLRLRALLERVDIVRIDHFRGFEAYWEIPAGSKTAATGRVGPRAGARVLRAPSARSWAPCR